MAFDDASQLVANHYDDIARDEARTMLAPLVEQVGREYLLIDRKTACKLLCMSITYFDDNFKNTPQLQIIQRKLPQSNKVFYDPNELKRAMLSILE